MSDKLQQAISFAEQAHAGQYRKNGMPAIEHPLAVMSILQHYMFDGDILVAAVLHDTCEDSTTNNIQIRDMFGERVGFIIEALTKNEKPKRTPETEKMYEQYRKEAHDCNTFEKYMDYRFHIYINRFYVGVIADPWIMFVKMADQIHNLQTMGALPFEKRKRKIFEIETYFVPIYERAKELMTPMYSPKYDAIFAGLREAVFLAKQLL